MHLSIVRKGKVVKTRVVKSRKVIFKNHQSPGDIIMLSAAVRDLKLSHPDILIDVDTVTPAIWENNPYITSLNKKEDDVKEYIRQVNLLSQESQDKPCGKRQQNGFYKPVFQQEYKDQQKKCTDQHADGYGISGIGCESSILDKRHEDQCDQYSRREVGYKATLFTSQPFRK